MDFHLSYTGDEVQSLLEKAGTALQEHQDLSNYYTKDEVDSVVLEETTRAKNAEEALSVGVEEIRAFAEDIDSRTDKNEFALEVVTKEVKDISLVLSEDGVGVTGRLSRLEKLVGGDGASTEGSTLLKRVGDVESSINKLKTRMSANEQAVSLLNKDSKTKGSVDYKIQKALSWTNIG